MFDSSDKFLGVSDGRSPFLRDYIKKLNQLFKSHE